LEDQSDTGDPLSILLLFKSILEGPLFIYIFQGLIIILLLFLSGFLSSLEFAFSSLTSESQNTSKNNKVWENKYLKYLNLNSKQAFASLRILKNILTVSAITLTTFFLWGNHFLSYPIVIVAAVIMAFTVALIFFNEVLPKILVKHNYSNFILNTSFIFFILFKVFQPVYKILSSFYNPKKRTNGKKAIHDSQSIDSKQSVEIDNEEASELEDNNLSNIVFDISSVKEIMQNRLDIVAFDYDLTFNELLKEANTHGYSRIPVYKENIDNIEGIIYVKDLLMHIEHKLHFDWHLLIRPGFFVPESKKIEDLLKDFQEKKVHMAIVVDEYGGTSGLVTLEDILEEIVGEINDEFDKNHSVTYSTLDENTFIFEGKTPLSEFEKIYNLEPEEFDVADQEDSLGDFLLELFGKTPSSGDQVTYNKFEFTVIGVEKEKISRVKVFSKEQTNKEGQLVGR